MRYNTPEKLEKHRIEVAEWRKNNRTKSIESKKKSYYKYVDKNRSSARRLRNNNRFFALDAYSQGKFVCACCRCNDYDFLTIDHIDNEGAKHRKKTGCSNLYSWLKVNNYPEGFQVLCYNCNSLKGHYGYCRVHQEPNWEGGEETV